MRNLVFIYGVPGSGKTFISRKMADSLNLSLLEADTLKDELRKLTTKEESPFLFLGTCQAYRYFGESNEENIVKGLKSVRQALHDRVDKEIEIRDDLMVEGAFLDPNLLIERGKIILVITSNEEQHRKQFFEHRDDNEDNRNEFRVARIIQEFLIKEAKNLPVEVIENDK